MLDQLWHKEGILCTSYWYLKVRRKGNIWRGKKKLVLHLLSLFFIIYNCVYKKIWFMWLICVVNMLFLLLNMGLICWDHHMLLCAAIPQALLHVTLVILQSADVQISKDPQSLCMCWYNIFLSLLWENSLVSLYACLSAKVSSHGRFLGLPDP